jgi:hypothetical protein
MPAANNNSHYYHHHGAETSSNTTKIFSLMLNAKVQCRAHIFLSNMKPIYNLAPYLGFEVLTVLIIKNFVLWNMLSPLKVNGRFGGTIPAEASGKPSSDQLAACVVWVCLSETLSDFQRITWPYIPDDTPILTFRLFSNHFNITISFTKSFFK